MGIVELNPVCDITTTISRGSLSVDTYYDNRLGVSVGILFRNGVNAIIPPQRSGASATGFLEIYLHYRCMGLAQLNQFSNLIDKHPHLARVEEPTINDTTLKLVYRISKAELLNSDEFYVDELDITIVLNPVHGMPMHARDAIVAQKMDLYNSVSTVQSALLRVGVPWDVSEVIALIGGKHITLPAFQIESGHMLEISRMVDGQVTKTLEAIDPRHVIPVAYDAETAEVISKAVSLTIDVDQFSADYGGQVDNIGVAAERRDISKEIFNIAEHLEKTRAIDRTEELARIKHAQALAGESTKAIGALSGLGAKILDTLI